MRKITLLFMFAAFAMSAQTYNFGLVQGYNGGTDYDITVFAYPDFTAVSPNEPTAADAGVTLIADTGNGIGVNPVPTAEYEGGPAWVEDAGVPDDASTLQGFGIGDGTKDCYRFDRSNAVLIQHDVNAGVGFPMFTFQVTGSPSSGVLEIAANSSQIILDFQGVGLDYRNSYQASIPPSGVTQQYYGTIEAGVGQVDFSLLSNPDAELTGISMYPNPAKNNFAITGLEQEAQVQIHDMNGKLILSKEQYTEGNIDVSALQTGIYFVKISSDNKSTTEKLVVE